MIFSVKSEHSLGPILTEFDSGLVDRSQIVTIEIIIIIIELLQRDKWEVKTSG